MIYKYKIIYTNLNKSKMLKGGTHSTSSSTTSSSTNSSSSNSSSTTSSSTTSSLIEQHDKLSMYDKLSKLHIGSLRAVIGATKEPIFEDGTGDNYERVNRNKNDNEKFNVFFDKNHHFKYFPDINLYTIKIDFNNSDTYDLFFNEKMKLKYEEIAFDHSTVSFLRTINIYFNLIEKLLNVLNYEGKLFIPIKKSFNYGPQHFIDLFEKRFMTNNDEYKFIEEPYPFERNDYLIERNYNEDYLVIEKKKK
jgi:hypothetical protein